MYAELSAWELRSWEIFALAEAGALEDEPEEPQTDEQIAATLDRTLAWWPGAKRIDPPTVAH